MATEVSKLKSHAPRVWGKFNWEDPMGLEELLTEEERLVRETARQYAQEKLIELTKQEQALTMQLTEAKNTAAIKELENETSDDSKNRYLIAKSKIEALNSTHYKKI